MLNQKTFESLYNYYFDEEITHDDESEEELYHHGVLGQSWGKKHGPPYPLGGVDKKIARAEARKKKEKERKLKKMQRAAKKARKEKKREEERQADILKKKQKLMKKGDMQAIRKNADLFTNEELAYIMEREDIKKGLKSKKERSDDEKMELFMKRLGQIGQMAASAQQVASAIKVGSDIYKNYKETKVKELEAEDKRMSTLKTEFEMRFQPDERSSAEAKQFIDDRVNDRTYKPSKEKESSIDKAERKMDEDKRKREVADYYKSIKASDKAEKKAKREERESLREEKKNKKADRKRESDYDKMVREAEERRKQAKSLYEERVKNQQRREERERRSEAKAEKAYNKTWESNRQAHEQSFEEFMKRTSSSKTKDYGKKWTDDVIDDAWSYSPGSSNAGKDWISSYYGLNNSRSGGLYLPYKN